MPMPEEQPVTSMVLSSSLDVRSLSAMIWRAVGRASPAPLGFLCASAYLDEGIVPNVVLENWLEVNVGLNLKKCFVVMRQVGHLMIESEDLYVVPSAWICSR